MVQVKSLSKKRLPLSMSDKMVGTDTIDPTKPVKNFDIQELSTFFLNGWSFSTNTFVIDSNFTLYPQGVNPELNPDLVPPAPAGKTIVIDPRFAVWKIVHDPNNPAIANDPIGIYSSFLGQLYDSTGAYLAQTTLAAGAGYTTNLEKLGIGRVNTPQDSINKIVKLRLSNAAGITDYQLFITPNGSRLLWTAFGPITFTGRATVTTTIRYKHIDIT
jgi:hypothetical protein